MLGANRHTHFLSVFFLFCTENVGNFGYGDVCSGVNGMHDFSHFTDLKSVEYKVNNGFVAVGIIAFCVKKCYSVFKLF